MSRRPTSERLGRLLAIVPWVAAHDGPLLEEVCRRFDVSEPELVRDLDLLFLCGVHPFTPDSLIEVDVADGRVWIRYADWFRRPLRLTPPEGLALVSAASALLAVPGADPDGALAGALTKLETVLGVGDDEAIDVELGQAPADLLGTVRGAVAGHRKLEIDYYSFGRDGHSTRVVHPWRLFSERGAWYLAGWCEQAVDQRLFRVDRVRSARLLDAVAEDAPAPIAMGLFHPKPDDPVVTLDLDPPARWIAEQYPTEFAEEVGEGRLRVRMRSGGTAWLERVLLRAGPHAHPGPVPADAGTTVAPQEVVARAARRLLARYAPVSSAE